MPALRVIAIGEYKFTMFFFTGSMLEDGIVIPPTQRLTRDYLRSLSQARKVYKYFQAEIGLDYDDGEWLTPVEIGKAIEIVRKGQRLGILAPSDYMEHVIRLHSDTEYRAGYNASMRDNRPAKRQHRKEAGFVYLVKSSEGYYKIGRAKKLGERVTSLGVQLPFPIEIIHSIKSDDYKSLEKRLHALFDEQRVRGEWFKLSPDDIEYIKGL